MDSVVRHYNWLAVNRTELKRRQDMFALWVNDNIDKYTIQVSYPRSGRHWIHGILNRATNTKIAELRTIKGTDIDARYFLVHPMVWPDLDVRLSYVLLLRDPRDMILSCINYLGGKWDKGFWAKQCLAYKNMVLQILNFPNVLVVQYEQLCWNGAIEIERILEFANLERDTNRSLRGILNDCAQINFDAGCEHDIDYDWRTGPYFNQCLKWRKHPKFLKDGYHQMIWSLLSDIMLPFGYIESEHSSNLFFR